MRTDFTRGLIMNLEKYYRQKSLEILEQQDWGYPATVPTNLVKRCIELSKVPVDTFTFSDLRLLIGQQIGLPFLVPIAKERLQDDIFVEADYYEGDLLSGVLEIDAGFWRDNQNFWKQLNDLIEDKRQELEARKFSTKKFDKAIH